MNEKNGTCQENKIIAIDNASYVTRGGCGQFIESLSSPRTTKRDDVDSGDYK